MPDQKMTEAGVDAVTEGGAGADQTRRRLLKIGAALAAGAVTTTMLNREDGRAAGLMNGQSVDGYGERGLGTHAVGVSGHSSGHIGVVDPTRGDGPPRDRTRTAKSNLQRP